MNEQAVVCFGVFCTLYSQYFDVVVLTEEYYTKAIFHDSLLGHVICGW
jgi:hypothetical protein